MPIDNIATRTLREYYSTLQLGASNQVVGTDLTAVAGLFNNSEAQSIVEEYTAAAIDPAISAKVNGDYIRTLPYPPTVTGMVTTIIGDILDLLLSPERYGAVGDGVTDDTLAVQKAFDAIPVGGDLRLKKQYKITTVTLKTIGVTLHGPGGFVGGTLVIGDTVNRLDYKILLGGVSFDGGAVTAGTATIDGISFRKARRVTILACRFKNLNKAISVPVFANAGFHDTAMIRITGSDFDAVNYALHVDHSGAVDGWTYTNDCWFTENVVNLAYVSHVWCKGIDGIHVTGNTFFFVNHDSSNNVLKQLKEYNIYVGQSDWAIVSHNNCFEPGLESIVLDKPKRFVIANNAIAWPGAKTFGSGIKLTGQSSPEGTITGNTIDSFTRHGIEVLTQLGTAAASTVVVGVNNLKYNPTSENYYGPDPLSSIPHFGVYLDPTSPTRIDYNGGVLAGCVNSISGTNSNDRTFYERSRVGGFYAPSVSVTASNTKVAVLTSRDITEVNTYGGTIVVEAKTGTGTAGNESSYVLHVAKTGAAASIAVISQLGLLTGGAANHPSFTWSVDATTNELRASPIASTSGTFFFTITYSGNLRLYP